ncbi:hypothetical protein [Acetobacter vaccinii]|uniref:Uncharacterized protein n=1 Tax=Acetobacter vaccinii TaxID=2592655 RepID=A0A5C1YML9_9PROT|nr:hypothetical protein [Acetobacter vaccinii]QEO16705.1 hypothetical protein FLP30_02170 [Acetobacter vaccinii]
MRGLGSAVVAILAGVACVAAPPAAFAGDEGAHPGLRIIKVRPGPPPMTVATAAPGILDYDGIPTVEHTTTANVAGLMYYCNHHNLVVDTTVRALGRRLAGRADVKNAPDYAWGGQGMLRVSPQRLFDLSSLAHDRRAAVCARAALAEAGRPASAGR